MTKSVRSMYMDIKTREAVDGNSYRVTIAANEKVRQPPELDFGGLATDNYIRNPVVMWAHDTVGHTPSGGLPIGRTIRLAKTSSGEVVAEFEFLSDDAFAQRVKNAWDKGFLQAASISWIPLETVPVAGGGWRDAKSDLLEWSIVSVPADPEALRESHLRLIDEYVNNEHRRTVCQDQTVLSPDDYDDLSTAFALLKDVLGGVEVVKTSASQTRDSPNDLSEISQMLGAIRVSIRETNPTS